MILLFVFG